MSASQMEQIVAITEADLTCHTDGETIRYPGRHAREQLFGWCGKVSGIMSYVARKNGLGCSMFQNHDIHTHFAGEPRVPVGPIRRLSFAHALAVVTVRDEVFLGDMSFGQFCSGDTITQFNRANPTPSSHPLAVEIISKGYVKLDDSTLQQYLRMTTGTAPGHDTSYINTATVDSLLTEAPVMQFEGPDNEIENGYEYHMPFTCADFNCPRPNPIISQNFTP